MSKVKVGLIGAGRFGRLHLSVLANIPDCEVAAVSDLNEAQLQQVQNKFNIRKIYTNPLELIEDPDLDAVDIVTDEDSHAELILAAVKQNKKVFVEKPLCTSLEDAMRISEEVNKRQSFVMTGHISRFSQPYISLKRVIESGSLGKISLIRAKRDFSKVWFENFGKRTHPVYESGIHDLDLILWYANSKCEKVVSFEHHVSGYQYPDLFSATLQFSDGMVATVESSWLYPETGPKNLTETLELDGTIDADIQVIGTKGTASVQLMNSNLKIWSSDGSYQPELTLWPGEYGEVGGAIRSELKHFISLAASDQQSHIAPLSDAVESMRIAEAIIRSAGENRIIEMKEFSS